MTRQGIARWIAVVFGAGLLPKAPGTWGSLAALPLIWICFVIGGAGLWLLMLILLTVIGWWATAVYMEEVQREDPSEVVIDEVVGQMLTFLPVVLGTAGLTVGGMPLMLQYILGFVLFRLFDILKPWPVSWADQQPGATGVMLDDLLAGLMAALILGLLGWFWLAFY